MSLTNLRNKRAIDLTAGELADIVAAQINVKPATKPWVDKEERNKILYCKSDAKANHIMKWGKDNLYQIRKRGGSYWNRLDLESIAEDYYRCC